MDFFGAQRQAQSNTARLIFFFACAVVCLIFGLYLLVSTVVGWDNPRVGWWNPEILLLSAIGTLLVVGLGMLYKISQLRGGGAAVCHMMRAKPVPLASDDRALRGLRNVTEEMAIASGVPVPQLFIMEEETGINAFAAGFTIGDAAICVTRGCIEKLSRDELQGVIAHEFSHILNGDMRLNIRLMGVLHGIVCISLAGYILMRGGRYGGNRRGGALAIIALGLGLIVLGSLGALFAKLIKAAVSRQREFLADASAVQFTRNPAGISGALEKIAGLSRQGRVDNPQARAASHMFFVNSLAGSFTDWFATHPPIQDRIEAIGPQFARLQKEESASADAQAQAAPSAASLLGGVPLSAAGTIASIGQVTPEQVSYSQQLLADLPEDVTAALHDPFSARAVVYCLLLDRDGDIRRRQFARLQETADPATLQETLNLSFSVRQLDRRLRLPLIDLAMPALRTMSLEQARTFRENIREMIDSDSAVSLFEFTVEKILNRHLDSVFVETPARKIEFRKIQPLLPDCAVVLSMLARVGNGSEDDAVAAFSAGALELDPSLTILPPESCSRDRLEKALDNLVSATPTVKQTALTSFARAVVHVSTAGGAELLRAVSEALECPMPPAPVSMETSGVA